MKVAIIMPSRNRPMQMERNVRTLMAQPLPHGVELLIIALCLEVTDTKSIAIARKLQLLYPDEGVVVSIVYREENTTCVQGFNQGYDELRGAADWYVLGSDDQIYADGWLKAALITAQENDAHVIGLNDGHTNLENYAPHFMMSDWFIESEMSGYMVPPEYKTWWFDREICERAIMRGIYAPAWGANVEHCHPDWGTAVLDDTYNAMIPERDSDKALYLQRKELNYES
jgi:glycosyltransferase involved in cell wall biosynthesis